MFRQAQTPAAGVELMEAHIADLCREHEIALAGSSRGDAIRWRGGRREISVPPIRGQVSYFIALHEIGHLIGRGGRRRGNRRPTPGSGRSTTAWSSRRPPPAGRSLAGCAVTWSGPATASTAGAHGFHRASIRSGGCWRSAEPLRRPLRLGLRTAPPGTGRPQVADDQRNHGDQVDLTNEGLDDRVSEPEVGGRDQVPIADRGQGGVAEVEEVIPLTDARGEEGLVRELLDGDKADPEEQTHQQIEAEDSEHRLQGDLALLAKVLDHPRDDRGGVST